MGSDEIVSYIPYEFSIEEKDSVFLFVKFKDIYQHLDKQHIYSQIASATIYEAGEFDFIADFLVPDRIDNPHREYWVVSIMAVAAKLIFTEKKSRL